MLSGQTFNVGVTTVQYDVNDGNGNSAVPCTFTVTVTDNELPILTCPGNTTVILAPGVCTAVVGGIDAVANDNCATNVSWTLTGATTGTGTGNVSGQTFNAGITTVQYDVNDGNGNSAAPCTFTVTVTDNELPTLTCPGNATANVDPGVCTAVVSGIDAVANDNCATNVSWTLTGATTGTGTGNVSGQTFNAGITTVQYDVNDGNGNFAVPCTFTVTVTDNELPTLTCPGNATANVDPGVCTAVVNSIDAVANDNCGVTNVSWTLTGATTGTGLGNVSGQTFNTGITTVQYDVNDGNGNSAPPCTFTVTVTDNELPTLTCPGDTTTTLAPGVCTAVVGGIDAVANDNCGVSNVSWTLTGATTGTGLGNVSGQTFNTGITTVQYDVNDGNGNSAAPCTFTVTIMDTTRPVAICQNITIALDNTGSVTIAGIDIDGGSTDDCNIVSYTANPNTYTCVDAGMNNVTLIVADASGNVDSCVAVVTITDTVPPEIVCNSFTVVPLDSAGNATITVNDVLLSSSDSCGIDTIILSKYNFTGADLGLNTIATIATDFAGNTDSCIAFVLVEDTIAPNVICRDITVQLDSMGNVTINENDIDGGTTDAGGIDSLEIVTSSFNCSDVGDNDVVLLATDSSGNVSFCTAVVTVEDTINPTVVCQNITVFLDSNGRASITGADIDGGSFDRCGVASTSASITDFTCANLGINNITLIVADSSNNIDSCMAVVTVMDTITPTVTCQDITANLDTTGNVNIVAGDLYGGDVNACNINAFAASMTSFNCANTGQNNVILTVTGVGGGSGTCMSIVTIIDTTSPTITCLSDQTLYASSNCALMLPDYSAMISSTDNCNSTITITQSPIAGTLISSNTTVQLTATDISNNMATCSFSVNVLDTIAPIITCLTNQQQALDENCQAVLADYTTIIPISDNCDNNLVITQTPLAGTIYKGGQTLNVILAAEDASGNIDNCIFNVNLSPETFNESCIDAISISNLLTPNGDGKNDTWVVSDPESIQGCRVMIFNRWNKNVYESFNYKNDWGGTLNGSLLPEDTYYYVIECDGIVKYRDALTIIRLQE